MRSSAIGWRASDQTISSLGRPLSQRAGRRCTIRSQQQIVGAVPRRRIMGLARAMGSGNSLARIRISDLIASQSAGYAVALGPLGRSGPGTRSGGL